MFITSQKWIFASLFGFVLAAITTPAMAECSHNEAGCVDTLQYEFPVEGGSMLVTNAQIKKTNYYGMKLTGTVTNKTNLNWSSANFKFRLLDENDNKLEDIFVAVDSLNAGESKPLGHKGVGAEVTGMMDLGADRMSIVDRRRKIDHVTFTEPQVSPTYKYIFSMKKPKPSSELSFEDKQVSFQFEVSGESILLYVKNNTDDPFAIDWNNVAYIDAESNSHRVFHGGVKYIEKEKLQVQTMVPPGARVRDTVSPIDYATWKESYWSQKDLLPYKSKEAAAMKGQSIRLFIPLEINGHTKNYNFEFGIDDVLIGQ